MYVDRFRGLPAHAVFDVLVFDWYREVFEFIHVAVMHLLVSGITVMFGGLHASLLISKVLLHGCHHVEQSI